MIAFLGIGLWNEAGHREWRRNAEYILTLEKEGRLEEALKDERIGPKAVERIEWIRAEYGPIRWYKIVGSGGYPKGIGHGFATVIILRGDVMSNAEIQSEGDRIRSWAEVPALVD